MKTKLVLSLLFSVVAFLAFYSVFVWAGQKNNILKNVEQISHATITIKRMYLPNTSDVLLNYNSNIEITFVTVPRRFTSTKNDPDLGNRQRAAVQSWLNLVPQPKVLFIGTDPTVKNMAEQLGVDFCDKLEYSKRYHGAPMMDSIFAAINSNVKTKIVMYVNTDMFFPQSFMKRLQQVLSIVQHYQDPFLVIGPRLEIKSSLNMTPILQLPSFPPYEWNFVNSYAEDYFVFRKGSYSPYPPFLLGRYVWDNWMVNYAVVRKWNVISGGVSSWHNGFYGMHPDHNRGHHGNRNGPSVKYNERLARSKGGWAQGGLMSPKIRAFIGNCSHDSRLTCLKAP